MLKPFVRWMEERGHNYETIRLYDKNLNPCKACRACQRDWMIFGCVQRDDMQEIFDAVLACDLLVLATPIYSWYCTPPMKSVLDRLVYGMNKYYGKAKGPALWMGKPVALVTTCGYPPEIGADLREAVCNVIAGTPSSNTWVCWRNVIWVTTPYLWMRQKPPGRRRLPTNSVTRIKILKFKISGICNLLYACIRIYSYHKQKNTASSSQPIGK